MVLIDMDMPKCCKDCIFWNYYEGNCRKIKASEWKNFDTDEEYEKRAYGCPLKSADDYKPILDKIRAEIVELQKDYHEYGWAYDDALNIIDKYREESEEA